MPNFRLSQIGAVRNRGVLLAVDAQGTMRSQDITISRCPPVVRYEHPALRPLQRQSKPGISPL